MAEDNIKNFIKMLSGKKDDSLNKRKIEAIRNYFRKEEEEFNQKYEKLDYRSYNKLLKKLQDNNLVSADEEKITEISVKKYFLKNKIKKLLAFLSIIPILGTHFLLLQQGTLRSDFDNNIFTESPAYYLNNKQDDNLIFNTKNLIETKANHSDLISILINATDKKIDYFIRNQENQINIYFINLSLDNDEHKIFKYSIGIDGEYDGNIKVTIDK